MHQQSSRQLQESTTSLAPSAVLDQAVQFFARQSGVYAAFPEKRGPTHVMLRGMGGEEIAIAAWTTDAGTQVSGSTYLFDQQVTRFLNALPPSATVSAPPTPAVPAVTATPAIPSGASVPAITATPEVPTVNATAAVPAENTSTATPPVTK